MSAESYSGNCDVLVPTKLPERNRGDSSIRHNSLEQSFGKSANGSPNMELCFRLTYFAILTGCVEMRTPDALGRHRSAGLTSRVV
jgi:hypothetical protein